MRFALIPSTNFHDNYCNCGKVYMYVMYMWVAGLKTGLKVSPGSCGCLNRNSGGGKLIVWLMQIHF